MTNRTATILAAGAFVLSLISCLAVGFNGVSPKAGSPTAPTGMLLENYVPVVGYNGGLKTALPISMLSAGTSTLFMKSSSATQGFCMEFNATSTATVVNMTATTTTNLGGAQTGLLIAFGACN